MSSKGWVGEETSHETEQPDGDDPDALAQHYLSARSDMVRTQIAARGITNSDLLAALESVPRHRFVPEHLEDVAYTDYPLRIGEAQTISQPYVVALMTHLLAVEPGARVLEIGTGSGYQTAVLAALGAEVWTLEILESLGTRADRILDATGYGARIRTRIGDGYRGWPEAAPFDGIVVTAAPDHVPAALLEQLAVGARMVIPVGNQEQDLVVVTRTAETFEERRIAGVLFVPMTGEAQLER